MEKTGTKLINLENIVTNCDHFGRLSYCASSLLDEAFILKKLIL